VSFKRFVAVLTFAVLSVSTVGVVQAAEKEEARLTDIDGVVMPLVPASEYTPQVKRPAMLPVLYATLGAMQAWDVCSTNAAMKAGAREANPTAAAFAGNSGSLIGLKAATTASTIFFAERMWKKSKVGAIVMLAAINGATAVVSMHNMRNAKVAAAR